MDTSRSQELEGEDQDKGRLRWPSNKIEFNGSGPRWAQKKRNESNSAGSPLVFSPNHMSSVEVFFFMLSIVCSGKEGISREWTYIRKEIHGLKYSND